jgi:hypothetical protein
VHGPGAAAWTRPSMQRSIEHTRGSGTLSEVAAVVRFPSAVRKGSGTWRSVSARSAVSQSGSDPIAAAESTFWPCRATRCTRNRKRSRPPRAMTSTRKAVFSPRAINRSSGSARGVRVQCPHGETPDARNLLAAGDHGAHFHGGTAHGNDKLPSCLRASGWPFACPYGGHRAGTARPSRIRGRRCKAWLTSPRPAGSAGCWRCPGCAALRGTGLAVGPVPWSSSRVALDVRVVSWRGG